MLSKRQNTISIAEYNCSWKIFWGVMMPAYSEHCIVGLHKVHLLRRDYVWNGSKQHRKWHPRAFRSPSLKCFSCSLVAISFISIEIEQFTVTTQNHSLLDYSLPAYHATKGYWNLKGPNQKLKQSIQSVNKCKNVLQTENIRSASYWFSPVL